MYSYKPLRCFIPEESRAAAAAGFYGSSFLSAAALAEIKQIPPVNPPIQGRTPHAEAVAKSSRSSRITTTPPETATKTTTARGGAYWMCPACQGLPVAADSSCSHPSWRTKKVDFGQLADEGGLICSFKDLDELGRFFNEETKWIKWKRKNAERILFKSQRIHQHQQIKHLQHQRNAAANAPPSSPGATTAATGVGGGGERGICLLLCDIPGEVARELLQSMAKIATLHAIEFLKSFITDLADSPKDEDRQHFLVLGECLA